MAARRPKVREDLTVAILDGEAILYDGRTGEIHHLNPAATVVLELCDGTATTAEIAREIAEAYGEAPDVIERQIRGVIRKFRRSQLLDEAPAPARARA
jgi:PqqD family protein of HPr-rel-A system